MFLRGLTCLIVFQLLGSGLNALLLHSLPGPIIGLLLLLVYLMIRGEVSAPVNEASLALLRYLPLMLVPPAAGVMLYTDVIARDFWAIVGALVLSLLVSILFTGWLMQRLIERQQRRQDAR